VLYQLEIGKVVVRVDPQILPSNWSRFINWDLYEIKNAIGLGTEKYDLAAMKWSFYREWFDILKNNNKKFKYYIFSILILTNDLFGFTRVFKD
jgi:hypothetical protein